MSLGYGSKQYKYLDLSLQDEHRLQFRGDGDFLQISDFDDGASMQIGTTSALPGILRIRPVWSTAGIALTNSANTPGIFVDAVNSHVGIGTITPLQTLDVAGNASISGRLQVNGSAHAVYGTGRQRLYNHTLALESSGGTSSTYPYIEWRRNGARGAYLGWGVHGSYFQFQLESGNSLALLGGNVGIGTTTPQYALDVNGIIRGTNVSPSDARLKEDIATLDGALTRIARLRGTKFRPKARVAPHAVQATPEPPDAVQDDPHISQIHQTFSASGKSRAKTSAAEPQKLRLGVIAQEVEQVFPEAVFTDDNGYKAVAYDMLIAPLIEAVKELNAKNEALTAEIDALKAQNAEFERRLQDLEAGK
jgi:chaperonin cofactor prefoldin